MFDGDDAYRGSAGRFVAIADFELGAMRGSPAKRYARRMWRCLVVLAVCGDGSVTRDGAITATAIVAEIRRVTGW